MGEHGRGQQQEEVVEGLLMIVHETQSIMNAAAMIRFAASAPGDLAVFSELIASSARRILEIAGNLKDPTDDRGMYHEAGGSG